MTCGPTGEELFRLVGGEIGECCMSYGLLRFKKNASFSELSLKSQIILFRGKNDFLKSEFCRNERSL